MALTPFLKIKNKKMNKANILIQMAKRTKTKASNWVTLRELCKTSPPELSHIECVDYECIPQISLTNPSQVSHWKAEKAVKARALMSRLAYVFQPDSQQSD